MVTKAGEDHILHLVQSSTNLYQPGWPPAFRTDDALLDLIKIFWIGTPIKRHSGNLIRNGPWLNLIIIAQSYGKLTIAEYAGHPAHDLG